MKIVNIDEDAVFEEIAAVLRAGGLVVHPTETCYGFAVDVFNEKALEKLYKVKGMLVGKPLSILVSDIEMARDYAEFSELSEGFASKYWPGALSLVLPRSEKLPESFNIGNDFVSMRVSEMDFCNKMVREFSFPVTTTSVNRAGELPLYSVDLDLLEEFAGEIDLLVDAGLLEGNLPSTILKVDGDNVEILRQGACEVDLVK